MIHFTFWLKDHKTHKNNHDVIRRLQVGVGDLLSLLRIFALAQFCIELNLKVH